MLHLLKQLCADTPHGEVGRFVGVREAYLLGLHPTAQHVRSLCVLFVLLIRLPIAVPETCVEFHHYQVADLLHQYLQLLLRRIQYYTLQRIADLVVEVLKDAQQA